MVKKIPLTACNVNLCGWGLLQFSLVYINAWRWMGYDFSWLSVSYDGKANWTNSVCSFSCLHIVNIWILENSREEVEKVGYFLMYQGSALDTKAIWIVTQLFSELLFLLIWPRALVEHCCKQFIHDTPKSCELSMLLFPFHTQGNRHTDKT